MRTNDFDFSLPSELVAQCPLPARDQSRLLVFHRPTSTHHHSIQHSTFPHLLDFLRPRDLLVLNDSRVIPARLIGHRSGFTGEIESFLIEEIRTNEWWSLLRPGKRIRVGDRLEFHATPPHPPAFARATVIEKNRAGHGRLQFEITDNILDLLPALGQVPLPPYITRVPQSGGVDDRERYQTVFAAKPGSVAAPTAGLHFTPEFFAQAQQRGIEISCVTLHVGLGTFAPVKTETIEDHTMHEEWFELTPATAAAIAAAKGRGSRVVAVGTTSLRVLESVAAQGSVRPMRGRTRIFIYPPYPFRVVDALLTNFHLPQSTLLMLVSAFAAPGEVRGRDWVLEAYRAAIEERYRFFSYGDAMLIL